MYFVLDFAPNGDLYQYMAKRMILKHHEIQFLAAEILNILRYMHSKKIVHRDVKFGNILLDANMHVKMADFGSAKFMNDQDGDKEDFQGTLSYVSPEMIKREKTGPACDLWALGVMMF